MVFFVTGATSFVGLELCRYLVESGHKVIAMTRRSNEHLSQLSSGGNLNVFNSDMQNLVNRAKDITANVFIHLAWAGTSHEERDDDGIHEENVRLSLEYVRLAKTMGCELYVDAGSQAEYGIVPGIIHENTPCNPFTAYGKGKLKMYQRSSSLTKELDLKYIHLRILSVYGENDHEHTLIKTTLNKLKKGEPVELHSGGQKWNYVYVKDAARQISELTIHAFNNTSFRQEVYNIASNDTRKLQDFIIAMKEITKSSSELIFGGYDPVKDVNLNPDMNKTACIVKPLTEWRFEDVIKLLM